MKLAAAFALAFATAGGGAPAPAQIAAKPTPTTSDCSPSGELHFVCGINAVEDLAPVPGGRFLVGSAYRPGGPGLHVIDMTARTGRPVRVSFDRSRDPAFAGCNPPDLARLQTHGIAVRAGARGSVTVYAINHGGRESVEVFRLDPAAATARWVGCLILPSPASGNALTPLEGGRLAITRFYDAGDPQGLVKVINGETTGLVYLWTPGKGFAEMPGSRLSGDNGVAASADGRWLFISEYGRKRIWRLPLGSKGAPTSAAVPFHPDNLRWAPDGTLLATGQFVTPGKLDDLHDWATVRLDPFTMRVAPLLRQSGLRQFDSATTAVQAGGLLWFGSFRGDRIAYRPLPPRK